MPSFAILCPPEARHTRHVPRLVTGMTALTPHSDDAVTRVSALSTKTLCSELAKRYERPWNRWLETSAGIRLAALLKPLEIGPRQLNSQVRGYERADFERAFARLST